MSTMKSTLSTYPVYYGPSTVTYPTVGSVSAGEAITVLWRDGNWYYIRYDVTGTTNKKCGYVQYSYVNLTETVSLFSSMTDSNAGATRYVNTSASTYTGYSNIGYVAAGSVSRGEAVVYLGYKINNYAFIEYSLDGSSQKKRAFFYADYLSVSPVSDPLIDMVNIAIGEIGYTEGTNNNTKYGEWYGMNNQPWCAMFVSWCANQAGILTTNNTAAAPYVFKEAYVPYMYQKYADNNRIMAAASTTPQIGDIAFCQMASSERLDHVAIVSAVNGNQVTFVEGNSSQGDVRQQTYTNNGGYIKYYGR